MSGAAMPRGSLDERLARLCRTVDAAPGFEARLAARLARTRPLADAVAIARARERLQSERRAAERALGRRLRSNLALIAGTAIAAAGPVWLCAQLLAGVLGALPAGGGPALALASGGAFLGWVGALLARTARGQPASALLA